jgi:hypothetical protein
VGAETAGMHDTLGYALMVEVKKLLTEMKVLEQRWSAVADLERVLIIADGDTLLGGEAGGLAVGRLMHLAAAADANALIGESRFGPFAGL